MSLLKLAERFERKLAKYAEEVGDSGQLTLTIRPKINGLLESYKPRFLAAVGAIAKSGTPESGDLTVGDHFFTSAAKVGGKWVVKPTSHVQVAGSLADHPRVKALIDAFNAQSRSAITFELNRIAANLQGDTITDHDSWVSKVDTGY